jgi:murein tripeptide amidase MpaA
MQISADLCGGNIQVVGTPSDHAAELALRPDSAANIKQWFYFKARVERGVPVEYRLVNAGEATYRGSWDNYRALASYDLERWFRIPTTFDGKALVMKHIPDRRVVHYGYFAAYPLARHEALVARAAASRRARVTTIGKSLEQRPIEAIEIGKIGRPKRKIWVVTRQHSGETQGAWFVEGLLDRLLDEHDALADALLDKAVFLVAPNVNPDGSTRGNFRTNVAGRDLNREWKDPSDQASPEILCLKNAIHDTGVDLFLDVHGEESAPCAFFIGCEGNPHYSPRQRELERRFADDLAGRDRHFWRDYGYGPDDPGKGDLRISNNFVGEAYDCLSVTLEMPFKEGGHHPGHGGALSFSPEVAKHLGRVMLETIAGMVDSLR